MDGVTCIEIPTPFNIGPVNCYVLTLGGLTIVDPGPATDDAYRLIMDELDRLGQSPEDVERILITHAHIDHFGNAHRLAAETDATVYAHEYATERLANPIAYFHRDQAFFSEFLPRMGVPENVVATVTELPEPYTRFQEPVTVDNELSDEDTFDVGATIEVLHTPGHSPDSVCYLVPRFDGAFTGDHVMQEITPNPLLTLDPSDSDGRTRSLPTYLSSLQRLRERGLERGYAGHRSHISNLSARINATLGHHETRKEEIYKTLATDGPLTAYEVMQSLFPDLPVTETFSGMSETIGHLDLLEDESRIEQVESSGEILYRLT